MINSMQETVFQKPTEMVYFTYANSSKTFEGLQLITAEDGRAYIFTYFSPKESFNQFLPYITDIVNSTRLLGS